MSASKDEDLKRLADAVNALSEHFDSVSIFVTRYDGGDDNGTVYLYKGFGNYFSRYGQIRHWLVAEDEGTRQKVREDD